MRTLEVDNGPENLGIYVCTYNACARTYIAVDPLPCGEISRAAFIGKSLQKHAARFRGQCRHARAQTASIITICIYICTYNVLAHTYIAVNPLPCGKILRAAFIRKSLQKHAAKFRGRQDFEVRQDFEEIQYVCQTECSRPCPQVSTSSLSR